MNPNLGIGLAVAGGAGLAWYEGWLSTIIDGPETAGSGPGTATGRLSALDPQFRARAEMVAAAMLLKGYRPRALETYRDPTRQAYYQSQGWSHTSQSFHNIKPAYAIDVVADGITSSDFAALAEFYKALRDAAPTFGLRSGGSYTPITGNTWAQFGLGWDPGHLEPASADHISPAQIIAGVSPW